jgi:hypothetical protein
MRMRWSKRHRYIHKAAVCAPTFMVASAPSSMSVSTAPTGSGMTTSWVRSSSNAPNRPQSHGQGTRRMPLARRPATARGGGFLADGAASAPRE